MGSTGGYWRFARWNGAPVRAHWTLPLGALLFGQGRIAPGFWLGFALVVLVHELGHAYVIRKFRLVVEGIYLHGLGGECRWAGEATPIQRARIAWGGVNAQLLLFFAALLTLRLVDEHQGSAFVHQLADAFTTANLFVIALNLLPVGGLDGAEAWKLPGLLRAQSRARAAKRARARTAEGKRAAFVELARLDDCEDQASEETAAAVAAKLRELARGPGDDKPS